MDYPVPVPLETGPDFFFPVPLFPSLRMRTLTRLWVEILFFQFLGLFADVHESSLFCFDNDLPFSYNLPYPIEKTSGSKPPEPRVRKIGYVSIFFPGGFHAFF
jgi:hypothetical protein